MSKRPSSKVYCPERFVNVDKKVLRRFGELMVDALYDTPDGIQLPSNLGRVMITGFQMAPRDHNKSNTYGQHIRTFNEHSEGYVYIPFYMPKHKRYHRKKTNPFKHANIYKIRLYKPFRQEMARRIKAGMYTLYQTFKNYRDAYKRSDI